MTKELVERARTLSQNKQIIVNRAKECLKRIKDDEELIKKYKRDIRITEKHIEVNQKEIVLLEEGMYELIPNEYYDEGYEIRYLPKKKMKK